VESVSDAEPDRAWKRILAAAKRYDVNVSESDWRELAKGGKDRKRQPTGAIRYQAGSRRQILGPEPVPGCRTGG
jgi:hypothetical protein